MATKQNAEEDQVEVSADIAAETEKPKTEKPAGSPGLKPLTALRRRERANFQMKLYQGLPAGVLEQAESNESFSLSTPGMMEFAVQYTANLEEAYAMVSFDQDAYDKWVQACTDEELQQLHDWYQEKYPMGEA